MTPKEAIELVEQCGLNIEGIKNIECESLIISALEKQIPKKVELYTNDGNFKWKNYPCPCCREMLGLNVNKRYIKFCPNCGQALDWGDSE
jgi:hypothetical protein